LHADAAAAQEAGAFSIVLECIPAAIAGEITASLKIPTIGIGAGPHCDGQVLVTHDMLGLTTGHVPKFVRQYADLREVIWDAVTRYRNDVETGVFPAVEHQVK
jgi:3-methyl-2-oxobutanoate hydroxymethyltransferase